MLTRQPLKPYLLERMEALSEKDDRIAIMAELIYGEGAKKVTPEGASALFWKIRILITGVWGWLC
ncbi:hypothetical protein [Chitinophaga pinensis]|uniref:Uncharacterized protein n=1 Tax=Chitinophaga pinensis TaxID=79329 RepID=A0A5C6LKI9_9BACT|nr:hypothetical protein [Chitinophaga pinensis]TWV93686.1 hypothetical protein FEF09_26680 [Chitinophaga pinensis]